MRFDKNDMLTPNQIFTLIASGIVGTGILSLARVVSEVSGRDGWISTFIAGVFMIINTIIINSLAKRFPNQTLVEYLKKITGKYIAAVIIMFYILFAIFGCAIILRILLLILNTWFLRATPRAFNSFIMVLLMIYLSRNGIKVLGRFIEFTFIAVFPVLFLLLIPLFLAPEFINIRPIGQEGIVNILKGALPALFAYSGIEILLIYYPFVTQRNKVAISSISAVTFVTILYTVVVALQLIVFPQSSIRVMWMPLVNYVINVRFPFFERGDLVFIVFWIVSIFGTAAIQYYTATVEIKQLFNLKDRKAVSVFLAPIVYFASIYPKNLIEINMYADILNWGSIGAFFIIPTILLLISVIFSIKGDYNE